MRLLKADEISAKVKQVFEKSGDAYAMLLLYKDSRCDMNLLDEEFGSLGWKREHIQIGDKLFCTVSVWDKERGWVAKQDVGTASDYEKEKGEVSDAFKRACTNWGIGRELYSSPQIYVKLNRDEVYKSGDKMRVTGNTRFSVGDIAYGENREIVCLKIIDQTGAIRFEYGGVKYLNREQATAVMAKLRDDGLEKYVNNVLAKWGIRGLSQIKVGDEQKFIDAVRAEA